MYNIDRLRRWLAIILVDWAHRLRRHETGDEAARFVEFAAAYLRKGG